jgi:transcriptional regulator with XRE-family HTH domain
MSNALKIGIAARGITFKELAKLTGYSYGHILNISSGSQGSLKALEKIESVLGMKIWSGPEIGADQDRYSASAAEKDLEQGTRKSQPDDLPLRPGAIGAGGAEEIQRPTAAPLPGSTETDREGEE